MKKYRHKLDGEIVLESELNKNIPGFEEFWEEVIEPVEGIKSQHVHDPFIRIPITTSPISSESTERSEKEYLCIESYVHHYPDKPDVKYWVGDIRTKEQVGIMDDRYWKWLDERSEYERGGLAAIKMISQEQGWEESEEYFTEKFKQLTNDK